MDTSPEMLARAREKVPDGVFYEADLHDLPLADDAVDLVVCAIALSHVEDLDRALAELVRVLRPDGHLVISDSRGLIGDIGLPLVQSWPGRRARVHADLEPPRERLPRGRSPARAPGPPL